MVLDLSEHVTIPEAARSDGVSYTPYWIRRLAQAGKIEAVKVGQSAKRGQWLIHLPSLLAYIAEMERLGTQKHSPGV